VKHAFSTKLAAFAASLFVGGFVEAGQVFSYIASNKNVCHIDFHDPRQILVIRVLGSNSGCLSVDQIEVTFSCKGGGPASYKSISSQTLETPSCKPEMKAKVAKLEVDQMKALFGHLYMPHVQREEDPEHLVSQDNQLPKDMSVAN
jgi:hypothetical protein